MRENHPSPSKKGVKNPNPWALKVAVRPSGVLLVLHSVLCLLQRLRYLPSLVGCNFKESDVQKNLLRHHSVMQEGWNVVKYYCSAFFLFQKTEKHVSADVATRGQMNLHPVMRSGVQLLLKKWSHDAVGSTRPTNPARRCHWQAGILLGCAIVFTIDRTRFSHQKNKSH